MNKGVVSLTKKSRANWWTIIVVMLLSLLTGCAKTSSQQGGSTLENPNLDPLTPEQAVEYIEIFHLACDKTTEQILAGEDYILTATDETSDLLFRINFFTVALHPPVMYKTMKMGTMYPLNIASKAFRETYISAFAAREKYFGYITKDWIIRDAFLLEEHVESYPAEMYWFYKNIPEDILRRIYVEKDGMQLPQYLDYLITYGLGWDKGPWIEYDGTGSLARIYETGSEYLQNTDDRIAYVSEVFWNDPHYNREKELMQGYGFSEDNPLTFEWVASHPKEAYALATTTWEPYSIFDVRSKSKPVCYELTW